MLDYSQFTIHNSQYFDTSTHLLLAVSGGIDSVVLSHLVYEMGCRFEIAHCNFQLRGADSDRDEAFVRRLADGYGVPCHVARFDTRQYASEQHLSIEEAARKLRYDYFARLVNTPSPADLSIQNSEFKIQNSKFILATAHHRDDAAETFFLNLMRGTGIAGLHGIRPVSHWSLEAGSLTVVRPLLAFSRDEIVQYAQHHGLEHVEDSTNASLDYRRNRIRHQLMPLLREIAPTVDKSIQQTMQHLSDTEDIYRQAIEKMRETLVYHQSDGDHIEIEQLRNLHPLRTWLFELLHPYGFNAAQISDIQRSLDTQSGHTFLSPTHRLVRERTDLVISPSFQLESENNFNFQFSIFNPKDFNFQFSIFNSKDFLQHNGTFRTPPQQALFDADRLRCPLHVRHWRKGDRFHPFGMKGSRLLSDFFSDLKLSRVERESQWLLCDADDQVLWVVGRRADGRFAVNADTQRVLWISLQE